MKVVFPNFCKVSVALSIFAASSMLARMVSAMPLISGVFAISVPMCRKRTSASFFTSLRASPTASLTADITLGIIMPNCFGQPEDSPSLCRTPFKRPMQATLTFHFPAAPAPMCAKRTGRIKAGTAFPEGPPFRSSLQRSTAVPPGSDLSFGSSSSISTAGRDDNTAGGFHNNDRIVRKALSRVAARFNLAEIRSLPPNAMLDTSAATWLLYLPAPAPDFSWACASSLPSTALWTTATTSASHSKGPITTSAGLASAPAFFAVCAGAAALGFPPPSISSFSRCSRRLSRSASSRPRTYCKAAR
mmetsp:Transcript_82193/g.183325  ORF Transcript_82193/g.183325 Transcript_82193/m.183325 type:complete len:303 (-) Transcript_82193:404-1312(-)